MLSLLPEHWPIVLRHAHITTLAACMLVSESVRYVAVRTLLERIELPDGRLARQVQPSLDVSDPACPFLIKWRHATSISHPTIVFELAAFTEQTHLGLLIPSVAAWRALRVCYAIDYFRCRVCNHVFRMTTLWGWRLVLDKVCSAECLEQALRRAQIHSSRSRSLSPYTA